MRPRNGHRACLQNRLKHSLDWLLVVVDGARDRGIFDLSPVDLCRTSCPPHGLNPDFGKDALCASRRRSHGVQPGCPQFLLGAPWRWMRGEGFFVPFVAARTDNRTWKPRAASTILSLTDLGRGLAMRAKISRIGPSSGGRRFRWFSPSRISRSPWIPDTALA